MEQKLIDLIGADNWQKVIAYLEAGDFAASEALVSTCMGEQQAALLQLAINTVTTSSSGQAVITALRQTYHYRAMRYPKVTVRVQGNHPVVVQSAYGYAQKKKMGRPKAGGNGTGTHALLAYWGFTKRHSPGSLNEIVRTGVGSASYALAREQLATQAINVTNDSLVGLVHAVADQALPSRTTKHFALSPGESLVGKRVGIGLDGGRIRSRVTRTGRRPKGAKQQGYDTDWKEPKVLVIVELDESGRKRKGTKPIYEATMGGKEEFTELLVALARQLHLAQAKEIVCLGDGAPVLWDIFATLQKKLRIKGKTTEVVDFFHACEHIAELTQAHTKLTSKQQKQWYGELKELLRQGKLQAFSRSIKQAAEDYHLPVLLKHLNYFERHKDRMHYDQYMVRKLPIGSGVIESAIRRVVNSRIKAPGSFWKIDNAERLLSLRCALLSGRWQILMEHYTQAVSIRPVVPIPSA